jgi:predicted flap endonuclease-1-like 5' DNA nuclease
MTLSVGAAHTGFAMENTPNDRRIDYIEQRACGMVRQMSAAAAISAWETKRRTAPRQAIHDLSRIPGVGPSIAGDLYLLGVNQVADLRGADPERLYRNLCHAVGQRVDRCVLYVFRAAVYFASESKHNPDLLKWWRWKD